MKIIRLDFKNLRNEEWFQFFTEFKTLVEKYNPETLNIAELFIVFLSLFAKADEAMEKIMKSIESDLMVDADAERDAIFRGLVDAVKSATNHFHPVSRQAADKLMIVLNTYGNLVARPQNEETGAIRNFLQDMRSEAYAPAIETLTLGEWLNELERKNDAYEALTMERNTHLAGKTDVRAEDIRKEIDTTYRSMVARLEALMLLNGDAAYQAFVKELNTNIERYANAIAQRKGVAEAKKASSITN